MALDSACLKRLGLNEQPFEGSAQDVPLYRDALLDAQLERFLVALQQPGAILLITGSSGAGRSIQLMRLLGSLPSHFENIAFRGRRNTSFASVDVTIRKHLRSRHDDHRSRSLNDLLIVHCQHGVDMLIAIDDAHLLGSESLRKLLKLGEDAQSASPRGPRFVLMADTVMGRNYKRTLIVDEARQIQQISLAPFNHEQTHAYLQHRLTVAGSAEAADLLTPEVIRMLNRQSRGLPGELNQLAEDWLNEYCATKARTPPAATVDPQPEPEPEPQPAAEALSPPRVQEESPQSTDAASFPPPATTTDRHRVSQDDATDEAGRPKKDAAPRRSRPWLLPTATGVVLLALVFAIIVNTPQTDQAGSEEPPAGASSVRERIAALESEPPREERHSARPVATPSPQDSATLQHEADAVPSISGYQKARTRMDLVWLAEQNPEHFTIQLIALEKFTAVERYLEKHHLEGARIIPTRSLALAVIGSFPSLERATAALEGFPDPVLAEGYWIRSIEDIQNSLRR